MENLVFNVILLHIGETFDDRKESFKEDHPVLFKCFESVKKEFKDDNIIVFHSYEEIFEKFLEIKEVIDKKYLKFFYNKNTPENFKTDLIRILLTKYYENMLYIDADTYIEEGFKAKLLKILKKDDETLFYIFSASISLFFSKTFFEKINIFLRLFENDYNGDDNGLIKCNCASWPKMTFKYRFNLPFHHYAALSTTRNLKCKYVYDIDSTKSFNYQNIFTFQPDNEYSHILLKDEKQNFIHYEVKKKFITIEELLKELNFTNFQRIKLN